jgi:hypothetical protein
LTRNIYPRTSAYGQPIYKIIDQSLAESFVAKGLDFANLYFEFMDVVRTPGQEYRKHLNDLFRNKYKGQKFDLVLTLHQEALSFLLKRAGIFTRKIRLIIGNSVVDRQNESAVTFNREHEKRVLNRTIRQNDGN